MIKLIRTDSSHVDFKNLVKLLDADLAIRDGDEHSFYDQFNKIDKINHVIVAYSNKIAVGCGAIKSYDKDSMEVKRMFVHTDFRGNGIASQVLIELEQWTKELNFNRCILETGKKQPEAIQLYKKNGYSVISNYGQYKNAQNSVCFEKLL